MNPENQHINLIIKQLSNEISEEEKKELNLWIEKEDDNKKLFNDYQTLWQLTENKMDEDVEQINIDEELNFIKTKLGFNKAKIVEFKPEKKRTNFRFYSAAAAAMIVVFIGLFFLFNNSNKSVISEQTIVSATLPDNSTITLNRNSSIEYPKKFEQNRTVKLTGEAYFEVEHDTESPFVVTASDYNVQVVGTKFFVSTTNNNIEVIVNEGVVKVYKTDNPADSVILRAGDKYDSQQNVTKVQTQNFLGWKTGKIVFNNTTLKEIASTLSRTYGIEVEIKDKEIEDLRMGVTFNNQSIESVLKVISETMNVNIKKTGNKVVISK